METTYLLQDAQGAYYPINGPTTIGRDPTCQIRLADPEVSRIHALLWVERGNLYLRDEKTSNGTYLNELRLPVSIPIAVGSGSQLRIGQTFFTVVPLQRETLQPRMTAPVSQPGSVPQPQRASQLWLWLAILGVCLCLGLVVLVGGFFLFQFR